MSLASSHASTVQGTPSSQFGAVPGWQTVTGSQISVPLQYRPSSQAALFGVWVQMSLASSHASTVHATPSSQFGAVPGWQPFTGSQVSVPLQYRLWSQAAWFGVWVQTSLASAHASTVQGTPSSQ